MSIDTPDDWNNVTDEICDEPEYQQTKIAFRHDDTSDLFAIEEGTHHNFRYSVVQLNNPFWEDNYVLDTLLVTDHLDRAEEKLEEVMETIN